MCKPGVSWVNALAESPESGLARWIDASMQARRWGSLGILRTAFRKHWGWHLQKLDIIRYHMISLHYIIYRFTEIVVPFCPRLTLEFLLSPCIWSHLVHKFLSPNLKPYFKSGGFKHACWHASSIDSISFHIACEDLSGCESRLQRMQHAWNEEWDTHAVNDLNGVRILPEMHMLQLLRIWSVRGSQEIVEKSKDFQSSLHCLW